MCFHCRIHVVHFRLFEVTSVRVHLDLWRFCFTDFCQKNEIHSEIPTKNLVFCTFGASPIRGVCAALSVPLSATADEICQGFRELVLL
jgi:hypothetical protein